MSLELVQRTFSKSQVRYKQAIVGNSTTNQSSSTTSQANNTTRDTASSNSRADDAGENVSYANSAFKIAFSIPFASKLPNSLGGKC